MPGPTSVATMRTPLRPDSTIGVTVTSPLRAYWTMLRATSEIAVAISVWSVEEKPISRASARPARRAATRSGSALMGTRISSGIRLAGSLRSCPALLGGPAEALGEELLVEQRQPLLEVE